MPVHYLIAVTRHPAHCRHQATIRPVREPVPACDGSTTVVFLTAQDTREATQALMRYVRRRCRHDRRPIRGWQALARCRMSVS